MRKKLNFGHNYYNNLHRLKTVLLGQFIRHENEQFFREMVETKDATEERFFTSSDPEKEVCRLVYKSSGEIFYYERKNNKRSTREGSKSN